EEVHSSLTDAEEIIRLVGKRTVYSFDEVSSMSQKPTIVILFTWHCHLTNPLSSDDLISEKVLKRAPQSIMGISHEKYLIIKNRGVINERFTIN
ncbi:MAG: hypothetical protein KAI84_02230, partial [Gammaproteobacteria bacterium]|nr:hypothetical protein [Gammaproteobacteria bacterium]